MNVSLATVHLKHAYHWEDHSGIALPRVTSPHSDEISCHTATFATEVGGATCRQESMWDHDSFVWTSTSWAHAQLQMVIKLNLAQSPSCSSNLDQTRVIFLLQKNPPAHDMLQSQFRGYSFQKNISCYHDVLYLMHVHTQFMYVYVCLFMCIYIYILYIYLCVYVYTVALVAGSGMRSRAVTGKHLFLVTSVNTKKHPDCTIPKGKESLPTCIFHTSFREGS